MLLENKIWKINSAPITNLPYSNSPNLDLDHRVRGSIELLVPGRLRKAFDLGTNGLAKGVHLVVQVHACNTRFIKGHKLSNHIRARIKSHVYTIE